MQENIVTMHERHRLWSAVIAAGFTAAAGAQTDVTELVIYGHDSGPPSIFVRYAFDDNTYQEIGILIDQNGDPVDHPESLTYFPTGSFKGFYCVSTGKDGVGPAHYLHRINAFDASVTTYPTPLPYRGIRALVSLPDAGAPSGWSIFAYSHGPSNIHRIIKIHPEDGSSEEVMVVSNIYEGISQGPTPGTMYAVTGWKLYLVDYVAKTETLNGDHGHSRTEALEFAYGNGIPKVIVPMVPWSTDDGILFSFAQNHGLLIMNPADANTIVYPSTFALVDCEGMVFFTEATDPYGNVVVSPHD